MGLLCVHLSSDLNRAPLKSGSQITFIFSACSVPPLEISPPPASIFLSWSHQSQRTAARAQQEITKASYLTHTHIHPYNINYDCQTGTHTSHRYLRRGLHAACSALPCDVHPTSDILLADLAQHCASRIPTRFSWMGKSPYVRVLQGR